MKGLHQTEWKRDIKSNRHCADSDSFEQTRKKGILDTAEDPQLDFGFRGFFMPLVLMLTYT